MIDCGSSHCFIDDEFAISKKFPIIPIAPMSLRLIDGSNASIISRASTCSIKFPCGTIQQIRFLLTKLDSDLQAVLGLDWLTQHNLLIDWVKSSVTF